MTSNLPPGVTESMIPGNRPEDLEWENFHEKIDDDAYRLNLSVDESRQAWEEGVSLLLMRQQRRNL